MEELTKKQKLKLKAKNSAIKFKRELKKSVLIAITAAFGFLIALSWKELITEYMSKISANNLLQGKFIAAITITLFSVLGIMLVTKLFQEKSETK